MIYAAFTLWLLLLTFAGIGVYKLGCRLIGPPWLNRLLLPGTVVSEMAYIFGCLIMGGEIRQAKLFDFDAAGDGRPRTKATAKFKTIGPLVASLMAVVACGTAILIADRLLGGPVLKAFVAGGLLDGSTSLPQELPSTWPALWSQAHGQLTLIRRMCETVGELNWRQWQGPVFVYLAMCLSIRLTPTRRNLRATLGAVLVIAGAIALTGLVWRKFDGVMQDLWPLLTYIYATVLTVLVGLLIIQGLAALAAAIRKKPLTGRSSAGKE